MSVAVDEQSFWLGDWKVEPSLNRIVRGDKVVKIDPRNMQVLQLLASKPGHVFSQAEIEEAVWADVVVTSNSVYQSIAQLRRCLGDEKNNPRYIETIPRKGYRAVGPVKKVKGEKLAETTSVARPHNRRLAMIGLSICLSALVVAASLLASKNLQGDLGFDARENTQATLQPVAPTVAYVGDLPRAANLAPRVLRELSEYALTQGKPQTAREYLERALHLAREQPHGKGARAHVLLWLSGTHLWQFEYAAAERTAREALDDLSSRSDLDPERMVALGQLGYVLLESGKFEEAEVHLMAALERVTKVFGEDSTERAVALSRVGLLRFGQQRLLEAETIAREIRRIDENTVTPAFNAGIQRTLLVTVLLAQCRYKEAHDEAQEIVSMLDGGVRPDHPHLIASRDLLAKSLLGLGAYREAEHLLRENVHLWRRNDGWNKQAAWSTSALGEALLGQGRIAEAEGLLSRASLEIDETHPGRQEQQRYAEHQTRLIRLQAVKAQSESARSEVADVHLQTR